MTTPAPPTSASVVGTSENSLTLSITSPPTTILDASFTSSPILITGLNEATSYVFSYTSYFDNTRSDASSITISTTPAIPSVNNVNVISSTSASLSFTRNDTLGYTYDISATPAVGSVVSDSNIAGSSYTFNGAKSLTPSMRYAVDLYAVSSIGTKRSASNTITTYTVAPTVTPTVYDTSASLAFTNTFTPAYSGTLSYVSVNYAVRNSGIGIDASSATTTIHLRDLSESTIYDISAISYFANTRSDLSNLSITTFPIPPSSVTVTALSSNTSRVNFTPNTSLNYSYDISAVPAVGSVVSVTNVASGSIPYSITGLAASMSYTMNVYARSPTTGLKSKYARSGTVTTYTVAPTVTPTVYDTSASLTFVSSVTNTYSGSFSRTVARYSVRGVGTVTDVSLASSPLLLTGLSESTIYDVSVVSLYANTQSDVSYLAITTFPTPPSDITTTQISDTSVSVNFTRNNILRYTYDISAVPLSGTTITDVSINVPYTLNGLLLGTTYNINIFAISPVTLLKYSRFVSYFTGYPGPSNITHTNTTRTSTTLNYSLYTGTNNDINASSVTIKYGVRGSGIQTTANVMISLSGVNSGMMFYYRFEASDISNLRIANYATGSPVYDASMSAANIFSTEPGKFKVGSSSLKLTGSEFVQLPPMDISFVRFSVASWFNYSSLANSWARLFDFGNGGPSDNILWAPGNGLGIFNGSTQLSLPGSSSGGYMNGTWRHFAMTITGNSSVTRPDVNIYINGARVYGNTLSAYPNTIRRNSNHISKANWPDQVIATGSYIDDFRVYNRTITPQEIIDLCNNNIPSSLTTYTITGLSPLTIYDVSLITNYPGSITSVTSTYSFTTLS